MPVYVCVDQKHRRVLQKYCFHTFKKNGYELKLTINTASSNFFSLNFPSIFFRKSYTMVYAVAACSYFCMLGVAGPAVSATVPGDE